MRVPLVVSGLAFLGATFMVATPNPHNVLDRALLAPWVASGAVCGVLLVRDKRAASRGSPMGRGISRAVLAVFLFSLVAGALAVAGKVFGGDPHVAGRRSRCASNLRQIGLAIEMYAYTSRGAFPDRFERLLLTEDLTSELFVCYHTNDTPAEGPTTQAVAAHLSTGGHLSYVYLGTGLTWPAAPNAVIAYEPLSNHDRGVHLLFGDGTVQWFSARRAEKLIAELEAGRNPPQAWGAD